MGKLNFDIPPELQAQFDRDVKDAEALYAGDKEKVRAGIKVWLGHYKLPYTEIPDTAQPQTPIQKMTGGIKTAGAIVSDIPKAVKTGFKQAELSSLLNRAFDLRTQARPTATMVAALMPPTEGPDVARSRFRPNLPPPPMPKFETQEVERKRILEEAEQKRLEIEQIKPSEASTKGIGRAIYEGISSLPTSVALSVPSTIGASLGPIGQVAGAAITAKLAGAAEYEGFIMDARRELTPQIIKETGLKREVAEELVEEMVKDKAAISAIIEGGGEALANFLFAKLTGMGQVIKKPFTAAATANLNNTIKQFTKKPVVTAVKNTALNMLQETGTEGLQAGGQALARKSAGMEAPSFKEAVKSAIGPAAVMSLIMGGGGTLTTAWFSKNTQDIIEQTKDNPTPENTAAAKEAIVEDYKAATPEQKQSLSPEHKKLIDDLTAEKEALAAENVQVKAELETRTRELEERLKKTSTDPVTKLKNPEFYVDDLASGQEKMPQHVTIIDAGRLGHLNEAFGGSRTPQGDQYLRKTVDFIGKAYKDAGIVKITRANKGDEFFVWSDKPIDEGTRINPELDGWFVGKDGAVVHLGDTYSSGSLPVGNNPTAAFEAISKIEAPKARPKYNGEALNDRAVLEQKLYGGKPRTAPVEPVQPATTTPQPQQSTPGADSDTQTIPAPLQNATPAKAKVVDAKDLKMFETLVEGNRNQGVQKGGLVRDADGRVINRYGPTSTYSPEWRAMFGREGSVRGIGKDEVIRILDKLKAGTPLTERQQTAYEQIIETLKDFETRAPDIAIADDLNPGDSFMKDGEKHFVKEITEDGKVKIQNGTTEYLHPGETIEIDRGTLEKKGEIDREQSVADFEKLKELRTELLGTNIASPRMVEVKKEGGNLAVKYGKTPGSWTDDGFYNKLEMAAKKAPPKFEKTPAGDQAVIDGMAGREMPRGPIKQTPSTKSDRGTIFDQEGLKTDREVQAERGQAELPVYKRPTVGASATSPAPAFHSKLRKVIDQKMPNRADTQTINGIMAGSGVKNDELTWSGVKDFLDGKDKVSKQELLDYLDKNQVEVKEVVKGGGVNRDSKYALPAVIRAGESAMRSDYDLETTIANDSKAYDALTKKFPDLVDKDNWAEIVATDVFGGTTLGTKFSQYQLPGGENYREVLVTMPTTGERDAYVNWEQRMEKKYGPSFNTKISEQERNEGLQLHRKSATSAEFKSAHFQEGNILYHLRLNDHTTADGKKMLFIEEIQSDWHQKGRKEGYKSEFQYSVKQDSNGDWIVWDNKNNEIAYRPMTNSKFAAEAAMRDRSGWMAQDGVPPAPFSKTWHEQAMKRALRYAAENGYDGIGWTPGEVQAERYDLSKQIDNVKAKVSKMADGELGAELVITGKNGEALGATRAQPQNEVANHIGKELADKIFTDGKRTRKDGWKTYAGLDLKVGGEGMKGFYDKMLVDYANKYAKKWGSGVGNKQIGTTKGNEFITEAKTDKHAKDLIAEFQADEPTAKFEAKYRDGIFKIYRSAGEIATVHYLPITDAMRSDVMYMGQELYAGLPLTDMLIRATTKQQRESAYAKLINRFAPIENAMKEAKKAGAEGMDIGIRAREYLGIAGKFQATMNDKTFRITKDGKLENTGEGLRPILQDYEKINKQDKDLDDISQYMQARRAIADKRGVVTLADGKNANEAMRELRAKYGDKIDDLAPIAQRTYEFQKRVSHLLVDAGIMSEQQWQNMIDNNPDYIPFDRVFEEEGFVGGPKSKNIFTDARNPLKTIKGSKREIENSFESILKNTFQILDRAERNTVAKGLADIAKFLPERAKKLNQAMDVTITNQLDLEGNPVKIIEKKAGRFFYVENGDRKFINIGLSKPKGVIEYYDNGERKYLKLDENLYNAMSGLNEGQVGDLVKILAKPTQWLRTGVVISPEFWVRNSVRDQFTAFLQTDFNPKVIFDTMGAIADILKKSDTYHDWLKSGGAYSGFVDINRENLREKLSEVKKNPRLIWKLNVLQTAQDISGVVENATRVGIYKRAIKRGDTNVDAAFKSREGTLDFARHGSAMKEVNALIAFFNPSIQGTDKFIRTMKEKPTETILKAVASITLPSLALWAINKDDPEYQEMSPWLKDLFWNFKINGTWYRIPKPYLYGQFFGSSVERMLDRFYRDDPDAMDGFAKSMMDAVSPVQGDPASTILPTAIRPLVENATNWSFFREAPVVPKSREGLTKSEQYSGGTTETAKGIGRLLNRSPAKIENMIRGWGGTAAYDALMLSDAIYGWATGDKKEQRPVGMAGKYFVKGFTSKPALINPKSGEQFYDNWTELDGEFKTYNKMVKEGRLADANKLAEKYFDIDDVHKMVSQAKAKIKEIDDKLDLAEKGNKTDAEKLAIIEPLEKQRLAIYKAANALMKKRTDTISGEFRKMPKHKFNPNATPGSPTLRERF